MDEKTPHIHATVIPIVTGQRRKAGKEQDAGKKKYRTKSTDKPRLCADDVMSRNKLKEYQDSYAEAMREFGLQRGIEGSKANHISTREFYTNAIDNHQSLQEDVETLISHKDELLEQERYLYDLRDEAKGKFYDMEEQRKKKEMELAELEQKAKQIERRANPDKFREDFELLSYLLPYVESVLLIAKFCVGIGMPKEMARDLIAGKSFKGSGKLYSHEYERYFSTSNVTLKIEKDSRTPENLTLTINGQDHVHWFRQQYKDEMKKLGVDLDQIESQQKQKRGRGV